MGEFLARTDANPPHWAGEVIGQWDDHKLCLHSGFLRRHYWTDQGSIKVFCIKGTDGWELLVSLRTWRDKRTAAKRSVFFSQLAGRGRA